MGFSHYKKVGLQKQLLPKCFAHIIVSFLLPHEYNMLKCFSIEYRSNYFRKNVHLWVMTNWSFMRSIPFDVRYHTVVLTEALSMY
jgi:hypothetical protein